MMAPDLESEIDAETRALLDRFGFDRAAFEQLRARLRLGRASERDNRLSARLLPPVQGDIGVLPPSDSRERARLHALGLEQIRAGRVAVAILAGGMATRFGGVVKASVPVLGGKSFLDLKLADVAHLSTVAGGRIPAYVMTSFATHERVSEAIAPFRARGIDVRTFPQFISLRLGERGALFRDRLGRPSPYATGHGDLLPALTRAGAVSELRTAGVRHLFMSNVDNLAATLDPAIIGLHEESGAELTFEVVALWDGDKGGVPARVNGKLHVIEALRYPSNFDQRSIPLFSTNSFVFDVATLERAFDLTYFRVTKKVEGAPAIQFERLVNQVAELVRARGVLVGREGRDGRFLPVKDPSELEARRAEIRAVLAARGMDVRTV